MNKLHKKPATLAASIALAAACLTGSAGAQSQPSASAEFSGGMLSWNTGDGDYTRVELSGPGDYFVREGFESSGYGSLSVGSYGPLADGNYNYQVVISRLPDDEAADETPAFRYSGSFVVESGAISQPDSEQQD